MVKTEELKSFNLGSNPNGEKKYVLIWGYNSIEEIMLCKHKAEGSNPSSST